MRSHAARLVARTVIFLLPLATAGPLRAGATGAATLSGTVTGLLGAPVSSAQVSVRNVSTGQSREAQTDSAGTYHVAGLAPGYYQVSVAAGGLAGQTIRATLSEGTAKTLDVAMTSAPADPQATGQSQPAAQRGATQAPSSGPPPLSLGDLGIAPAEVRPNPEEQARLDKRSHMLKIHQRLGLITTGPMVASVVSSLFAGRRSSQAGRDAHEILGLATTDLYFTTAYFAIRAPKIAGTKTRGPIRVHKALAWIHGPGMILTPILGAIAVSQENRGERVHGIAKAHSFVAVTTAAAFGAAIISVSAKF